MNVFPVFARELRSPMPQRGFRKQRWGTAFGTALGFSVLLILDRWSPGFKMNRALLFWPLASMLPFCLLIIGLSRGGNVLSAERREGTLPLLLITRLSGFDIIMGKLLQSIFLDLTGWLVITPMLVLPVLGAGLSFNEIVLLGLAAANLLFFSLALGLFASIFYEGRGAASWCLLFLLPFILYSTPLGRLVPAGPLYYWMSPLQWVNPCEAMAHAQAAAMGFRPEAYWYPLAVTHFLGWCFVVTGGFFLPWANRWHTGRNAGARKRKESLRRVRVNRRSLAIRKRLLSWNPYLWLTSRDRWTTPGIWIWICIPPIIWGAAAWFIWIRGLNITAVLALATGATWYIIFLTFIPAHACRQMVADRVNGTLELILCTPFREGELVRGVWLSIIRHFLPPLIVTMILSAAIMIIGYRTAGFGGMLDPDDLGPWLFSWSAHIFLLPLFILALCWVAMRRALFAPDVGAASGIAFVQVVLTFWLVLWVIHELAPHSSQTWAAIRLMVAAVLTLLAFAWHARRVFLRNLRAAANRYSLECEPGSLARAWRLMIGLGRFASGQRCRSLMWGKPISFFGTSGGGSNGRSR